MNTYGLTLDDILARCAPSDGDCMLWTAQFGGRRTNGKAFPYPVISRQKLASGKRGSVGVRRIAYWLATKKNMDGKYLRMKCGDSRCLNPEHMTAVSRKQINKGPRRTDHAARAAEGRRRSPATKLNWDKAREIRSRLRSGEKGSALAAEYGVSPDLVSRINTGKAWVEASPFRL